MRGTRFLVALALICTSSLFAGGTVNDVVSTAGEKVSAKHVIQPLDVIQIEMLKVIPKEPYHVGVFDVLQVRANALPNQPIDNYYMVEAEGHINLGATYGSVHVNRMTMDEICTALNKSLKQWIKEPSVSVQLARASGVQPITGQYRVGLDGTINLRQYGLVKMVGKTVADAKIAIEKHLTQYLDSPEPSVDVVAYKDKVYYIITQGASLGDNVRRLPITGNETVLDAISQVNGLSQVSSKKIWIARPAPHHPGCQQILPIDRNALTQGADMTTNYQILPGDRLFIADDELSVPSQTMRQTPQTIGRNYNRSRNGQ
ncbi:MAG: polysaccharide biosynthesis/export family protein [Planctomycetota bacterium]